MLDTCFILSDDLTEATDVDERTTRVGSILPLSYSLRRERQLNSMQSTVLAGHTQSHCMP